MARRDTTNPIAPVAARVEAAEQALAGVSTPGEPTLPHAYYKTAANWTGLTLTTTPQAVPFGLTVFAQNGVDGEVPVWYDGTRIRNPGGRIFVARLGTVWQADTPTEAQARGFSASALGVSVSATLGLTAAASRAMSIAMREPTARVVADIDGTLNEITQHEYPLRFGESRRVDALPYFGGATMRANGAQIQVYLPEAFAAPVRLVRAELLLVTLSSAENIPAGS